MPSLVFLYVFNFGLLVFMSCVNDIIEKKRYLQNLKYKKRYLYFSFNFGLYSIHLDIVCYEQGVFFFFLLNRQSLLSVAKVIC